MIRFCHLFLLLIIVLCTISCATTYSVRTGVPITPIHQVDPTRIIILNTFDVVAQSYRDNKEQFFMVSIDKAMLDLSRETQKRIGVEAITIPGLTKTDSQTSIRDSLIVKLMDEHYATDAIVITSFNVYFNQTEVVVTRDDSGNKNREAHYDIVSNIHYLWYDQNGFYREEQIDVSRFHSTRSVLSGLLAAGPNVVKQQDEVYSIVEENTIRYLNLFLPGYDLRIRPVFAGKEFTAFKLAIDGNDYEKALDEAMLLTSNPDRKTAARANYNVAVMFERLERHYEVKGYLLESSRLSPHEFTNTMLQDY